MAAAFPTSVVTDAILGLTANGAATTLNGGINNSVTTITVVDTTSFAASGYITIDSEIISYTSKNSTQFLGCTRAVDSSSAASHLTGAAVNGYIVSAHVRNLQLEVEAIEADINARFGIGASSNAIVVPTGVSFTVGSGTTGTNNALAILNGGSGTSAGPILRLSRNSVQKGAIGTYGAIFGGASDNMAIYSPSNNIILDCAGTDIVTVTSTNITVAGNILLSAATPFVSVAATGTSYQYFLAGGNASGMYVGQEGTGGGGNLVSGSAASEYVICGAANHALRLGVNNAIVLTLDPDVYTTSYQDYSGSSTIVGWTSFTTKLIYYKKIGKLVFVWFHIDGTSNSTSITFTIPIATVGTVENWTACRAFDNGSDQAAPGLVQTGASSSTVTCFKTWTSGAWTASGRKIVIGEFVYQIA